MEQVILNIANIKFKITMPKENMSVEFVNFEIKETENIDVTIQINPEQKISNVNGKLIHDIELEWYIVDQNDYHHCIVKRDNESKELVARMDASDDWSNVLVSYIPHYPNIKYYINMLLIEIVFRNRILIHNGLVVHSSAILYKNECIMFSAPSGTGKSTQARLWGKYKDAVVINDDHPAVMLIEKKPIVYGTPWAGGNRKFMNVNAPLKAVVILKQSPQNSVQRLQSHEIISSFLPRCFLPYYDNQFIKKAMDLFEMMFIKTPVYLLHCRPDKEAVDILATELYSK